ncbi:MAG: transglutaminase, partial [Microcystaceae cyanobacterium]
MIADSAQVSPSPVGFAPQTIRPIAAISIYGIAFDGDRLLAVDSKNGYLLAIDPITKNTQILNPHNWQEFVGATGLAIADGLLWFTAGQSIYSCDLSQPDFIAQQLTRLDHPVTGIAVWQTTIYATCQKTGDILVLNRETGKKITRFYAPGIGVENITLKGEELWVSDTMEQTVYCLDRVTGDIKYS